MRFRCVVAAWAAVVRGGTLTDRGMVGFAKVLDPQQIDTIRLCISKRANADKALGDQ